MDLIITLSIYLPRQSFQTLFSLAALILPQTSDPQLQKKAYKLLPRLATSTTGILALQSRNSELQTLLLTTTASVSAPARRDRLAAISVVVTHVPLTDLHFIPSILSEVVISAKEVNEKARTAAFNLLVLMADKMSQGGTIHQSKIPHMDASAPTAEASLEEFFTMVSAGLVGSTPHMISASITALTRILYTFASALPRGVIENLVQTMDLFLTSPNREIVRSVLGFAKVAIISLPAQIMQPRLESLIPNLMAWSKEHKAQFRSKIKHILERAIRRFGFPLIERYCPEEDKKLILNIRKTKERKKRHKAAADEADVNENPQKRKPRFESEYDEALYGSDSNSSASDAESTDPHPTRTGTETYITEPSEPLDLLSYSSLAHINSQKPTTRSLPPKRAHNHPTTNGKLIFSDSTSNPAAPTIAADDTQPPEPSTASGGINAYVEAITGRNAIQRGRGGRLKFNTRREKPTPSDRKHDADAMDVDVDDDAGAGDEGGVKRVRFARGDGSGSGDGGRGGGWGGGRGGRERRGGGKGGGGGRGDRAGRGNGQARGGVGKRGPRRGLGGLKRGGKRR